MSNLRPVLIASTCLLLLAAPGLSLDASGQTPANQTGDFRGKMLMEILDTLQRDLEELSHKKRDLTREKTDLETDLAYQQEKVSSLERTTRDSRRQIEKLLRGLAHMKEPNELLLFFSTLRYHDFYVYQRNIRKIALNLAQRLNRLVDEKHRLDRKLKNLTRELTVLYGRHEAMEKEIREVEQLIERKRTELTERMEKIAAVENLFTTQGTAYFSDPPDPDEEKKKDEKEKEPTFESMKGEKDLRIPISPGRVVKAFEKLPEPPYGTEKMVRGWIIVPLVKDKKKEARDTAPVVAPYAGTVVFVGDIPGFGRLIILEHPPRHHTVYGNLHKTRVAKGEKVKRNQVIATIHSDLPEKELPYLYFELREDRIAINPKSFFLLRPLTPRERH